MLIAYHGRAADKAAILATLSRHREADALVQGYGYWKDGKGCAVGCTINSGDHAEYEPRFGIPQALARLEDSIFEGLPVDLARQWPERFMGAIAPGADLSRLHWHLLHWLLTTPSVNPGIKHPLVRDAVKRCADLIADLAAGKAPNQSAAESAASAAWSAESAAASAAWSAESAAASAAWSAAESAAESARSAAASAARSAESAAWSAENAARSAARSAESAESAARSAAMSAESAAESAAESGAWVAISDRLIELIKLAPIADANGS
jgi:hypothetical protein